MAPLAELVRNAMLLVAHRRGKTIKRRDIDYAIKMAADAGRLPRPYGDPRH
jgi:histone H3/H4